MKWTAVVLFIGYTSTINALSSARVSVDLKSGQTKIHDLDGGPVKIRAQSAGFNGLDGVKNTGTIHDFDDLWTDTLQYRSKSVYRGTPKSAPVMVGNHHLCLLVGYFVSAIAVGLFIEVVVLRSYEKDMSMKDAIKVLLSWMTVTAAFLCTVWFAFPKSGVVTWLDGYVLEMMLSVDNLFVFVLVMRAFKVPATARSKVLMIGVIAALLLRVLLFSTITLLVHWAEVINKVLGAFIVYCAYKMVMVADEDESEEEVANNVVVRLLSKFVPVTTENDGKGSIFIQGKATPIFLACGTLIFLDIVFAVDSVSAKTALISNLYLNYTSTGLAMFALRALYYVLESAVGMFEDLKYGISLILVLIGLKTIFPQLLDISDLQYLVLLVGILASCILYSVYGRQLGKSDAQKEMKVAMVDASWSNDVEVLSDQCQSVELVESWNGTVLEEAWSTPGSEQGAGRSIQDILLDDEI